MQLMYYLWSIISLIRNIPGTVRVASLWVQSPHVGPQCSVTECNGVRPALDMGHLISCLNNKLSHFHITCQHFKFFPLKYKMTLINMLDQQIKLVIFFTSLRKLNHGSVNNLWTILTSFLSKADSLMFFIALLLHWLKLLLLLHLLILLMLLLILTGVNLTNWW